MWYPEMNAIPHIDLKSVRWLPPNFEQYIFMNTAQNCIGFCQLYDIIGSDIALKKA